MTKPIDRAALAQLRDLTVGHAGADAPRCTDCRERLPQGADARIYCRRTRSGGQWLHRLYCPPCGDLNATFGADEFVFAVRLRAGRVGASVRPPLVPSNPTTVARSLAGEGDAAGRDPATRPAGGD
jgi:hypothetical protein